MQASALNPSPLRPFGRSNRNEGVWMAEVDPYGVGSLVALFLGVLLFAGGMYARRGGQLRTRQGAAVLAGMAAVIGILVFGFGVYALIA